jgi:hypothetical protein
MNPRFFFLFLALTGAVQAQHPVQSHPKLHEPVFASDPSFFSGKGTTYFVSSSSGDDTNPGTESQPWKTIQHALVYLNPGDTLQLREGIYFENVTCSIVGTEEQPITIQSYPGERAILDGGLPEFQTDPANAWQPGPVEGEYISKRTHRNIRDVLGLFADSHIGLQTYWHLEDLHSANEQTAQGNAIPFYCGPGLFYDKSSGRIHVRLAHTFQKKEGFPNYRGETDPRKLPLVIAPFRSVPLFLDQAMHVRFQNLVIRGGGYNTVVMDFAVNVEFDHVTIFGGTYGLRARSSGPVRMTHSAIIGQIPPWGYWSDNALQTYDPVYYDPFTQPPEPRAARNVARLPTHALLVTEGAEESDTFAYPYNNRWTISYCEFADGHDGIYFNGRHMDLHHCLITRVQDDGFYLSGPTPQAINDDVHIRQNYVTGAMTPFGAHLRAAAEGDIFIYGNIVDMRHLTQMRRPTAEAPEGHFASGALFLAHGRGTPRGMENIGFYHNTLVVSGRQFAGGTLGRTHAQSIRSVLNNLFVYFERLPALRLTEPLDGQADLDGNLHWAPGHDPASPEDWMEQIRDSAASVANVERWGGLPWAKHSRYGNPEFIDWDIDRLSGNDYSLQAGSIARDMAVDFPARTRMKGDVGGSAAGALQEGQSLRVGIRGRVLAGGQGGSDD